MYTYTIKESGYRILEDGVETFVQEGQYANIYPGATMEERAQNHIKSLGVNTMHDVIDGNYIDIDDIAAELASVETGE